MPSVNPVIYNYTNLQSWQEELIPLELQIRENLQFIEEQMQHLRPLQEELDPINLRISLIQSQIDMNMGTTQDFMHPGHHHHGGYTQTVDIIMLQLELARFQKQRDELKKSMKPYEQTIIEVQTGLRELSSRRAWLKEHIPAAQLFLKTLQEDPRMSVHALTDKIWDAFINYEDTHLTGLSPQVRICLIAVRYWSLLTSYPQGYTPEYINPIHRSNYLRLCGFLWDMYSKVKQEKNDAEFEKILKNLIESTHVAQHGDLPYPMQTGFSASAWFESNKKMTPGFFAIEEQNLSNLEEQIFNEGLTFIAQNTPTQLTVLQKHIINAVNLIDAEVKIKKQKHEEIDYHFYGRTVLILNSVLTNFTDKQVGKRLGDIAEYASGSNSVGKQVLGGLLIVLGILLIGASVAGFLATLGSSSLLSAWGISLGLALFEMELVCGIASSLAAATGIGLTFFAGPKAIESGTRKGLSQELMEIKEGIEHYGEPPPYSIAVSN
ncbi:Uncharacterised protein [Legionella steigerwaltii]|uniref:Uncharacterized protein n=1 Tax=Legionella steigerwaltii TaxID=460 RepID=A0A378L5A9_9GAMM|nr:hypothetical protein [Legionella steigerwaltii]KTD77267.1 hypothetical protein Lstg_1624 [Legionella steigerwaltii]STY21993.1 Uncharacterised protein [Legionella steigerwaltii]